MATDSKVTLKVATPAGPYEGTFEDTTKVEDIITAIVKEKNLAVGDAFELSFDGTELQPDRPIGSYNLPDNAVLDLTASGSAV